MASFVEITQLAARTVTVTVRGVEIILTENLMRDPAAGIKLRAQFEDRIRIFEDAVTQGAASLKASIKARGDSPSPAGGDRSRERGGSPSPALPLAGAKGREDAAAEAEQGMALATMQAQLAQLKANMGADGRRLVIENFVARVKTWNLTDGAGGPLPLNVDDLYGKPMPDALVPTELFTEVLEALDKEEFVPEASA